MNQTDIQAELTEMFATFDVEQGGIVIWHDPDKEFSEAVDELELPGIEILREQPGAAFELKRTLNEDLTGRNILLYRPRARRLEGDWLADIEVRARQFAADYTAMQLRALNAAPTDEMRRAITARKQALSKKTVQRKLAKLQPSYNTPQELERALIAVALGAQSTEATAIARAYLLHAYASDGVQACDLLRKHGCLDDFQRTLATWTGCSCDPSDFMGIVRHLLTSALARALPEPALRHLGATPNPAHTAFCHSVLTEWERGTDRDALLELIQLIEDEGTFDAVLAELDIEELAACDILPSASAHLLRRLFGLVAEQTGSADTTLALCAQQRAGAWSDLFTPCYEGIEAAGRLIKYIATCNFLADAATATAPQIWKAYTTGHFMADRWYRKLYTALTAALRLSPYGLDEDFRACCAHIERLYKNGFLGGLQRAWARAIESDLARAGHVGDVPRQADFYLSAVDPLARSGKRACVIVSDALRFEVAAELADVLERRTRGVCELTAMQSAFPSTTACGMAALLPARTLAYTTHPRKARLSVLVNGTEAPDLAARQEVLRAEDPNAVAVRYDTFFNEMGRSERKELVADARVVYIYHNTIDAVGDKPATEKKVFAACSEAIDELAALVDRIAREAIATSVVITADHGFLYTEEPLDTHEHAAVSDVTGTVIEAGRRYVIAREDAASDALMRVKLPGVLSGAGIGAGARTADGTEAIAGAEVGVGTGVEAGAGTEASTQARTGAEAGAERSDSHTESALIGFTPRSCARIRRSGGGENYVHGGTSLQELCVPVLTFTNKRAGTRGYVEATPAGISLVTPLDVISNSLFTIEVLQEEPVGGKVLPATYEVFVADGNRAPVTDIARIAADRADEDAAARTSRVTLSLKPGAATSEDAPYHLLARNTDTGRTLTLRDVRIRTAFAPSIDFGW